MTEEIRRLCGPAEAAAFERLLRLARAPVPHRDAALHRAQLRRAARPRPAARPGARPRAARRRSGASRRTVARRLRRRSAAPHLQLPVALRRAGALRGARPLRGHHLHGRGQRRRRARSAACTPSRGRWRRPRPRRASTSATRRRSSASCWPRARRGPVRGVRLVGGEVIPADAVVCNPDLPVAYRTLLPGPAAAPAWSAPARYSPSAVVWHVGVRGALPPGVAHHNIHFGRPWEAAFRALLATGAACPTRRCWSACRRSTSRPWPPTGRHVLYVLEPVPEPRRPRRLDDRAGPGPRRPRRRRGGRRLPDRHRGRGARRSPRLGGPAAWSAARRSPWRTRSARPGRSAPATSTRQAPGLVFAGSGTVPGVGVPMVLVSGMLAAERVGEVLP